MKKPNVIFFMVDALRPDKLGCYGYGKNTSPNIDLLAKQGVLCEKTFSTFNVSHRSLLSILSGRHVLAQEFSSYHTNKEMKTFSDSGGMFLQHILKKNGYKTYCLKKMFGWQGNGFDYYFKENIQENQKKWKLIGYLKKFKFLYKRLEYLFQYFAPKQIAERLRAISISETITDKAINIINRNKTDNFFLWIDYKDTHRPYQSPKKFAKKFPTEKGTKKFLDVISNKGFSEDMINSFRNWFSGETLGDIVAKYDRAVAYTDYFVGKVIMELKEKGILENTIIFLFADHGESLTENEIYFTHEGLYDVSHHVPLIINGKDIPKNTRLKCLVQLEDIVPTVLDLLKINYNPFMFDGESLLPVIHEKKKKIRDAIFMEEQNNNIKRRAIRTEKYKYVESPEKEYTLCTSCNSTHGDIISLFDLEKDSGENTNIAKKNVKLLIEMKNKLDKTIKDFNTINEKRKIQLTLSKLK